MATMIRGRASGIHRGRGSGRRSDVGLSHLVDELLIAFFVAMAVMWVVTAMAGIFV
jgi:hypothetical protein